MRLVLLAGGSGKRLWPLSTPMRPKQFIPIFQDAQGERESLVQRTLRLSASVFSDSVSIVTSEALWPAMRRHVEERSVHPVQWMVEPEARDTYPAVLLACASIMEQQSDQDELICCCPIDLWIEQPFFESLLDFERQFEPKRHQLGLISIPAARPSTKFGYMLMEEPDAAATEGKLLTVSRFVEKPDSAGASALIKQGACWNSGAFVIHPAWVRSHFQQIGLSIKESSVREAYTTLRKTSFDKEVLHRAERIGVKVFEGTWSDLGTWDSINQWLEQPESEQVLTWKCEDTSVINTTDLPVVAIGLAHLQIVLTQEGLLITAKDQADEIKKVQEANDK
ncbi:sugar phosphate nucleotidyltransferase [Marinicrinis sediminis]|uniref:Sugar phosphate nucleotidyltransferase n=1 Tax=Marinicrinis sediminis TaxID=1652465 RepID=A0ABW5RDK1_9BACL